MTESETKHAVNSARTPSMFASLLVFGVMIALILFSVIFFWSKVSQEQIIPDEVLQKIQTGGRPEIYLGGFVGKEMQDSFPDITGLTNRYQWDIVFPDGDIYMAGASGQGLYISPAHDAVVVYFSTGKQQEEIMARAITESL